MWCRIGPTIKLLIFSAVAVITFDSFVKRVGKIRQKVFSEFNAIIDLFTLGSKELYLAHAIQELFGIRKVECPEMAHRLKTLRYKITKLQVS